MKCVICKHGETQSGTATITLERNGMTLVVKSVPALICENCGEEYLSEETTTKLLRDAETAASIGVQVDVRQYISAEIVPDSSSL